MSLDRSLKSGNSLMKHRNVLTRAEKIARLAEHDAFDMEKGDPLRLPKVGNRLTVAKKKPKKTEEA